MNRREFFALCAAAVILPAMPSLIAPEAQPSVLSRQGNEDAILFIVDSLYHTELRDRAIKIVIELRAIGRDFSATAVMRNPEHEDYQFFAEAALSNTPIELLWNTAADSIPVLGSRRLDELEVTRYHRRWVKDPWESDLVGRIVDQMESCRWTNEYTKITKKIIT